MPFGVMVITADSGSANEGSNPSKATQKQG